MNRYTLTHLSDRDLLCDLATMVARDRASTAVVLAHIAEVDARQLYRPAGLPSMFEYCVQVLHLSDDSALKRIRASRAARQYPPIFDAVADGRLHLSGLAMLARHLTAENAAELLAAAENKTRPEIALLIAERFPQPDLPARVEEISGLLVSSCQTLQAPGPVDASSTDSSLTASDSLGSGPGSADGPRPKVAPLAPGRFALQATIGQATHGRRRRRVPRRKRRTTLIAA